MKVEQNENGLWNILDDDGSVINSFKTNAEAWRWLEKHELDPIWVSGRRSNRDGIPHPIRKE